MTPKKAKDENLTPVEETTTEEETATPVEANTPEIGEPEVPAENLDEIPAPAEEEAKKEIPSEWQRPEEEPKEESVDPDLWHAYPPVEEKPAEAPKGWKVKIKEEAIKSINIVKAPEEIKKIIEFYGITSKDLFDKDLKKFWIKKEEEKALKEWYATLA